MRGRGKRDRTVNAKGTAQCRGSIQLGNAIVGFALKIIES